MGKKKKNLAPENKAISEALLAHLDKTMPLITGKTEPKKNSPVPRPKSPGPTEKTASLPKKTATPSKKNSDFYKKFADIIEKEEIPDKDAAITAAERAKKARKTVSELRELVIEGRIDLHFMTVDEAVIKLNEFIREEKIRGSTKILVITGKGLHSPGGVAVLPKAIKIFLHAHKDIGRVEQASTKEGGAGALIAYIRD